MEDINDASQSGESSKLARSAAIPWRRSNQPGAAFFKVAAPVRVRSRRTSPREPLISRGRAQPDLAEHMPPLKPPMRIGGLLKRIGTEAGLHFVRHA